MEVKLFPAVKKYCLLFCLSLIFTGCMKSPGPFESYEDFQRYFPSPVIIPETSAGKMLTLSQAVEIALANNPTNLAAAQAVQAAKFGYFKALGAYAPEINAHYALGHTLSRGWELKHPPVGVMKKNDHLVSTGTLQASWLLFDGFARELEAIIAKEEYNKSAAAGKNVKRLLERAVAFAYYDMYLAGEEMIIYAEYLAFQNTALQQAETQFQNGHVSKDSVLNFQILAARAKSNISNARYRRQVAFHALAALMGWDIRKLPEGVALQKVSVDNLPPVYEEEFYLELAILNRPDLKAEKIALEISFRNKQKAYAGFFPEVRFSSALSLESYKADYGGYLYSDSRAQHGAYVYGIEGNWNLFRGFATFNEVRRQEVLEKVALWGLNAKFLEIAAEVRDARSNCKNSRYQIEIFQDMTQWVREQRDLVYSAYRNGKETITRLNQAQDMLVEVQSRLVLSAVEFNKAVAQLAAAIGYGLYLPELKK